MQSDNGANPDGWANEQPLKKQGAADAIRLEWSAAQRNVMKRYCGCSSPDERRKRPCGDWERRQQKKSCHFSWLLFFLVASGLWNGRRNDWLEQHSGTKEATGGRPLFCFCCLFADWFFFMLYLMYGFNKRYRFYCFSFWDLFVCKKRYAFIFSF